MKHGYVCEPSQRFQTGGSRLRQFISRRDSLSKGTFYSQEKVTAGALETKGTLPLAQGHRPNIKDSEVMGMLKGGMAFRYVWFCQDLQLSCAAHEKNVHVSFAKKFLCKAVFLVFTDTHPPRFKLS